MPEEDEPREVSRRSVIATAALVPVAAITAVAQPAVPAFSEHQRRILEAFIDRLIPRDEYGPGAVECGVATYIDRSFTGHLAAEKPGFLEGLAAVDAFAHDAHGAAFADLAPGARDQVLTALENNSAPGFKPGSAAFFARLRRLTLEGMFCDPYYGGNQGFAGWDLIRYPGARLAVAPEQQTMGSIKPVRTSVYGASVSGTSHGH